MLSTFLASLFELFKMTGEFRSASKTLNPTPCTHFDPPQSTEHHSSGNKKARHIIKNCAMQRNFKEMICAIVTPTKQTH